MAAKNKPVDTLTVDDLGLSDVGGANAREEITKVEPAEERKAGEIVPDEGDGADKIVAYLESIKVI